MNLSYNKSTRPKIDPPRAESDAPHRWSQFSLRTLLLAVTVSGILFGWIGVVVNRAAKQKNAVARIRQLGGTVHYSNLDENGEPAVPEWLTQLVGDDFFFDVELVQLASNQATQFTDADLAFFENLLGLKSLFLPADQLSDDALRKLLARLKSLNTLALTNGKMDRRRVEVLNGCANLKSLMLIGVQFERDDPPRIHDWPELEEVTFHHTDFTLADLPLLSGLPNLRKLTIYGPIEPNAQQQLGDTFAQLKDGIAGISLTLGNSFKTLGSVLGKSGRPWSPSSPTNREEIDFSQGPAESFNNAEFELYETSVSESGLEPCRKLPHLKKMSITRTPISNEGIAQCASLQYLREFHLYEMQVTDAGMAHLGALKKLQEVWLANERITDRGLEHLTHLKALMTLQLWGVGLSDASCRSLKNLTDLTVLNLYGVPISDVGIAYLRHLHRLSYLGLYNCNFTDETLRYLSNAKDLQTLYVVNSSIAMEGGANLGELENLQFLWLDHVQLDENCLDALGKLPKLQDLYLSQIHAGSDSMASLAAFPNLESLTLFHVPAMLEK